MVTARTHYSVLGVSDDASPSEVRDAYRRLARVHHPDRTAASAAGGDRMPAINEAYRVLSDPGRRAVYDATLRDTTETGVSQVRASPSAPTDDGPGDEAMRAWRLQNPHGSPRVPWRTLAVCTVIAIVAVVVLAQFAEPGDGPQPDGILRAGDCVEILDNGDAGEIPCTGEGTGDSDGTGDLVVQELIPFDRQCSSGTSRHRDRQGMGVACVEERPADAG